MSANQIIVVYSARSPLIFDSQGAPDSITIPDDDCRDCDGSQCHRFGKQQGEITTITLKIAQNGDILCTKCFYLAEEERFNVLLKHLNPKGILYLWVKDRTGSKKILKIISSIGKMKKVDEFICNRGYSELFPADYLNSIYYYYTRYNIKHRLFSGILYLLIKFGIMRILLRVFNPVRLIAFQHTGD